MGGGKREQVFDGFIIWRLQTKTPEAKQLTVHPTKLQEARLYNTVFQRFLFLSKGIA
eukprot:m.222270 g.222270  ORF g.222270 m.222270 type:complete len:57 (-) comp17018_c7_seq1:3862-4032(-)